MRNKISKFTINELNRVDEEAWFDELWFLRHSPAARRLFADMQTALALIELFENDDASWSRELAEFRGLAAGIEEVCCECISHHPWWHCTLNPNRVIVTSRYSWMHLAKELGSEWKSDECGEEMYKTILGWRQL